MNEKYNILEKISDGLYLNFRKFVVSNILSTDMKKHFDLLKKFETRLTQYKDEGLPLGKS